MIVYGFDCAIKNLGICIVEVNKLQYDKIIKGLCSAKAMIASVSLNNILQDLQQSCTELQQTNAELRQLSAYINQHIKIIFINTVILSTDANAFKTPINLILSRIKTTLLTIGENYPAPDLVLVEKQIKNDKLKAIQNYIECYYSAPDQSYQINTVYPSNLINTTIPQKTKVVVVHATLKNSIDLDKRHGTYAHFIEKYSNYTANKKHTTHNLLYFLRVYGYSELFDTLCSAKHKIDDVADAFMMIYAYVGTKHLSS